MTMTNLRFTPFKDDIQEDSFSLANNQSSASDITGLAFNTAVIDAFEAIISIKIVATANLYEMIKVYGIKKDSEWDLGIYRVGDNSGIEFTITNAGQIQYTSSNYSGFTSGTLKFRAVTLTI